MLAANELEKGQKGPLALASVATLALGVGAKTAIFSVVHAVLLRQLPYDQPERLVAVYTALPSFGYLHAGLSEAGLSDEGGPG